MNAPRIYGAMKIKWDFSRKVILLRKRVLKSSKKKIGSLGKSASISAR